MKKLTDYEYWLSTMAVPTTEILVEVLLEMAEKQRVDEASKTSPTSLSKNADNLDQKDCQKTLLRRIHKLMF